MKGFFQFENETVIGGNGFHRSDIDVFVYGLSPEESSKKIQQVISHIVTVMGGGEGHILVSGHSVTLLGVFPSRHVQFVLRCYR